MNSALKKAFIQFYEWQRDMPYANALIEIMDTFDRYFFSLERKSKYLYEHQEAEARQSDEFKLLEFEKVQADQAIEKLSHWERFNISRRGK
jgi:hypothetical protein